MQTGRFFVTAVMLFAIAGMAACSQPSHRPSKSGASADAANDKPQSTADLEQAKTIQRGLMDHYNLFVASEPKIQGRTVLHTHDFPDRFNWRGLSKEGRRDVQARLAKFIELVGRVLESGTQADREQLATWKDSAEQFQKSLENFEQVYGTDYDPKDDSQRKPLQKNARGLPEQVGPLQEGTDI